MGSLGKGLAIGVTAPLIAAGGAAIKLAIDAEETASKFETVLGPAAEEVNARIADLQRTIPMTRVEMQNAMADMVMLGKATGLSAEGAKELSEKFVIAAADLGSFNNVPTADALNAIRSAVVGQSKPLQQFGIDTKEATLQAIALEKGLIKKGEALSAAGRQLAIMAAIEQHASDAMGDAARTAGSTANQLKFLKRDVIDLATKLGTQLVPIIKPLITQLVEWSAKFQELSPRTQKMILIVAGLAAALGPVLMVISAILPALGLLVAAIGSPFLIPIGLVVAAIAALAAAFVVAWKRSETFRKFIHELLKPLQKTIDLASKLAKALWGVVSAKEAVAQEIEIIPESQIKAIKGTPEDLEKVAEAAGELSSAFDGVALGVDKAGGKIKKAKDAVKELADKLKGLIEGLQHQQREINLTNREMLEWELTQLKATDAQRELALELFDTNEALRENKKWSEEVTDQQKAWAKELNEIKTRLGLERRELLGAKDAIRAYELAQRGATAADIESIFAIERKNEAIKKQQADFAAAVAKTVNANNKKMDELKRGALEVGRAITGGFVDKVQDAFGRLRDVSENVFGGGGSGILGKVQAFGSKLLTMAGPAGVIFGAVDSIGKLFGIDLVNAVKKALGAIGKGIGEFFSSLGRAFGIGGHSSLAAKEFELFGQDLEKTIGGTFTDSFQAADAKVKSFTGTMREALNEIVLAWDEGAVELGKSAEGIQEDWRAIASAFVDLAAAGATAEEIRFFFLNLVDATRPLAEQVQDFVAGLAEFELPRELEQLRSELVGAFEGLLTEAVEAGQLDIARALDLSKAFKAAGTTEGLRELMEEVKNILFREPFADLLQEAHELGALTAVQARDMLAAFGELTEIDELREALRGIKKLVADFGEDAEGASDAFDGLNETLRGSTSATDDVADAMRDFTVEEVAEFAEAVKAAGGKLGGLVVAARDMRSGVVGETIVMFQELETAFSDGTAKLIAIWEDMKGKLGAPSLALTAPAFPSMGGAVRTGSASAAAGQFVIRNEIHVDLDGREVYRAIEPHIVSGVFTQLGPINR